MISDVRPEADSLLPLIPTLLAVAATEHITDAAHALGIPQPTVSRQLARASAVVGVPVIERRGRGIALTAAGKALMPFLERAILEVDAGLDAMTEQDARTRGRISVSFQNTLGENVLPQLIRRFLVDHPAVTFTLDQGARNHCLDRLDDGSADLAFVALGDEHGPDTSFALYDERLVAVLPEGHRLCGRRSIALLETADDAFVAMGHGYGMRSIYETLWAAAGMVPNIAFEGQDIHTVRGLVGAGLGISVLPRAHGTDTSLPTVEVPLDDESAQRRIGVVWPERSVPAQTMAFRDMVIRRGKSIIGR
ncbi:MAG: LysR substrate-binding domain-containing protein [Rhodococcus sp. (in: high G+C Gram-positive bacteria)]